jgi:hypothetical protein
VAVTVHFEESGVPVSMLLDLVEVARSHSRKNLAAAFAKVLDDFGISDKVSHSLPLEPQNKTHLYRFWGSYASMRQTTIQ